MSKTQLRCSNENKEELRTFLLFVFFEEWEGLKEAIRNGMGGSYDTVKRKQNTLVELISNLCFSSNIDVEVIEDRLEELIDELFDTWFEDNSVEEVANLVYTYSRKLLAGDVESLRLYVDTRLKLRPVNSKFSVVSLDDNMETNTTADKLDSCNLEMAASSSNCPVTNNTLDDGWEVPRYSRRKR